MGIHFGEEGPELGELGGGGAGDGETVRHFWGFWVVFLFGNVRFLEEGSNLNI